MESWNFAKELNFKGLSCLILSFGVIGVLTQGTKFYYFHEFQNVKIDIGELLESTLKLLYGFEVRSSKLS